MTDGKRWIAALARLLRRGLAQDPGPVPHVRVLTRNPDGTPKTWGPVYRLFGPDDWDDDDG
jgi:hypothetical protein